jgi:hypothetical protein
VIVEPLNSVLHICTCDIDGIDEMLGRVVLTGSGVQRSPVLLEIFLSTGKDLRGSPCFFRKFLLDGGGRVCKTLDHDQLVRYRSPTAHIHPDHTASKAVAAKLGLHPTGKLDDEGEMIWK